VLIAVCASYTAHDLTGRVALGRTRRLWLAGGATTTGLGIWSMHYIGMLAFHLPIPVEYDWPTVLLSFSRRSQPRVWLLYVVGEEHGACQSGCGKRGDGFRHCRCTTAGGACGWRDVLLPSIPAVSVLVAASSLLRSVARFLLFAKRGEGKYGEKSPRPGHGRCHSRMHYTAWPPPVFAASADAPVIACGQRRLPRNRGHAIVTFMVLGF
jgi:hypothetical protein